MTSAELPYGIETSVRQAVSLQKKDFLEWSKETRQRSLEDLEGARIENVTFEEYFNKFSPTFAEDCAARCGLLAECKKKGIHELLKVRSVRGSVGAQLSWVFGQLLEGKKPDLGDALDMRQAVLPSTADVLLTQDQPFTEVMRRVPLDRFEVSNFPNFVERVLL